MPFCSLIKGVTQKIRLLCFVLINSVILNLLCVRVSLSLNLKKRTRSKNGPKAKTREKTWFMFHFELNVDFFLPPSSRGKMVSIADWRSKGVGFNS